MDAGMGHQRHDTQSPPPPPPPACSGPRTAPAPPAAPSLTLGVACSMATRAAMSSLPGVTCFRCSPAWPSAMVPFASSAASIPLGAFTWWVRCRSAWPRSMAATVARCGSTPFSAGPSTCFRCAAPSDRAPAVTGVAVCGGGIGKHSEPWPTSRRPGDGTVTARTATLRGCTARIGEIRGGRARNRAHTPHSATPHLRARRGPPPAARAPRKGGRGVARPQPPLADAIARGMRGGPPWPATGTTPPHSQGRCRPWCRLRSGTRSRDRGQCRPLRTSTCRPNSRCVVVASANPPFATRFARSLRVALRLRFRRVRGAQCVMHGSGRIWACGVAVWSAAYDVVWRARAGPPRWWKTRRRTAHRRPRCNGASCGATCALAR
jgi:hypothetical protein